MLFRLWNVKFRRQPRPSRRCGVPPAAVRGGPAPPRQALNKFWPHCGHLHLEVDVRSARPLVFWFALLVLLPSFLYLIPILQYHGPKSTFFSAGFDCLASTPQPPTPITYLTGRTGAPRRAVL